MTATQGIKLDDTTRDRLQKLATQVNRSPHWLMRAAIERYLDQEESYEREKVEDMQRWERYQLTGEAIDNASVENWLGDLASNNILPCPKL